METEKAKEEVIFLLFSATAQTYVHDKHTQTHMESLEDIWPGEGNV